MKGNKNTIATIIVVVGLAIAIAVCVISWISNPDFWHANAAQAFTLLMTVGIAFFATQLKNDVRKKKEHAEQILKKIQMLVTNEDFWCIPSNGDKDKNQKMMTMTFRSLSNAINVLKEYGDVLGFKKEAEYIEKEFKEYRDFVSEHLTDMDYLSKSASTLRKHSENINNKCDLIILELY